MVREAKKEVHLANLMALVASTNPTFDADQSNKANEWLSKVKSVFTNYSSSALGIELTEKGNEELELIDTYNKFVKTLRPQLEKGKSGELVVTGLDNLFIAHGEKPPQPKQPQGNLQQHNDQHKKSDLNFKPG